MFCSILRAVRQGGFSLAIQLFLQFDQNNTVFSTGAVLCTEFRLLK